MNLAALRKAKFVILKELVGNSPFQMTYSGSGYQPAGLLYFYLYCSISIVRNCLGVDGKIFGRRAGGIPLKE
jgi:hypothetical protein